MYILRRAALRALSSPATSSATFSSLSTTSRSFVSVSSAPIRASAFRPRCLLPSLQLRFKSDDGTAASQEGEDIKVVKEEVTETPAEIKEAVEGSETSAATESSAPEVTATEGKTMSQSSSGEAAGQTVAPEETTRDTHAATPSAPSMSEGGGIPSRAPLDEGASGDIEANNTLYVGNLFFEVTDSALRSKFAEFGDIQTTKIIYDYRGLSKGFGYVTFNTVEEATKAREALNQQEFQGRRMTVNYQAQKSKRTGGRDDARSTGRSNEPSKTLFVGNMSYEMSDKDLSDLFRQCVNVVDVRVAIDRNTGSPRGFAHADFTDVESAMAAKKQLQAKEVYGRRLKVDYSASNPRSPSQRGDRGERSDRSRRNY